MHHLFPVSNSKRSDLLNDISDVALYALALLAVILMTTGTVLAQGGVAIGTGAPTAHASAALDVQSTTQGMLVPRMSTAQRTAIASPAAGLLVYDNTANQYYYYNGSAWQPITAAPGGDNWTTNGNSGTNQNSNFIGTTDLQSFAFRTNNIERMRIQYDGRVGFGTNFPGAQFDVVADVPSGMCRVLNGNSQGHASMAFVNQNAYSMTIGVGGPTSATSPNTGYLSTGTTTPLTLRTANQDRVRIDVAGNVGIGTTTPASKLHLVGDQPGGVAMTVQNTSATGFSGTNYASANNFGNASIGYDNTNQNGFFGTTTADPINFITSWTERMRITAAGNVGIGTAVPGYKLEVNGTAAKPGGGSWTASSDARLKQQVVPYTDGLSSLLRIKPVRFHYNATSKHDTSVEHVGVIAQDLKEVAPYMVGEFEMDGTSYLNVDNSAMTYMLVNSVKEQQARIEEQAKVIEAQQQLIADMQRRLQQLEAR